MRGSAGGEGKIRRKNPPRSVLVISGPKGRSPANGDLPCRTSEPRFPSSRWPPASPFALPPKIALADDAPPSANGGAITGVQAIKENTEHRDDIIGKMDKEAAAARANREKN